MTIQIMNLPKKIYTFFYIKCPKLKMYIFINTTAGESNFNKSVVLEMDNRSQQKRFYIIFKISHYLRAMLFFFILIQEYFFVDIAKSYL